MSDHDGDGDDGDGDGTGAGTGEGSRSDAGQGGGSTGGDSLVTVIVALVANLAIALAKSAAALFTGSASMVAEAAHSWSDTGNEVFLLVAERRGARPRDDDHPRGYGRSTYIWSLVAAFGLFSVGSVVSIWHGVTGLTGGGEEETSFTINYVVLVIAFLLEGTSFLQAARQVRGDATTRGLHPLSYVTRTSDPTLRAVFFEDSSALAGLLIAGGGIGLHQATGQYAYDAAGSIGVGLLLGVVAVFLMRRNMEFLLGEGTSPELRQRVIDRLSEMREIAKVTYLHIEYVGPQRLFVVAAVDLVGDDTEASLAVRLRAVENEIEDSDFIEDIVLTLSQPDDEPLGSPT